MEMWENEFLNLVFKFHNDLTVNKFMIIILLGHFWIYAEKERVLEEGKGKQILEEERA